MNAYIAGRAPQDTPVNRNPKNQTTVAQLQQSLCRYIYYNGRLLGPGAGRWQQHAFYSLQRDRLVRISVNDCSRPISFPPHQFTPLTSFFDRGFAFVDQPPRFRGHVSLASLALHLGGSSALFEAPLGHGDGRYLCCIPFALLVSALESFRPLLCLCVSLIFAKL